MTNKDQTADKLRHGTYPVIPVEPELEELASVDSQREAAERALNEFQRALAPLQGWRASSLWETVEEALDVLGRGVFHAWEYPTKPAGFVHWRERYITDKDAAPF
jgi:hypothetical protein